MVGVASTLISGVNAGIDHNALAADQARFHAAADHPLEHLAQGIAVVGTAVAVHRERRMVRDPVLQAQPADPSSLRLPQ